ncbi:unnamed protein product [Phaeothamnion confervicola]
MWVPDEARWRVLLTLATLNLLSDWICFSVAPISAYAEAEFPGLRPSVLVAAFLVANVSATLTEPYLLRRFGLHRIVVAAAAVMLAGNLLKAGLPVVAPNRSAALVVAGFVVVGAAQPFFQVTAVATIQNWLPVSERTLGTMVALNANQLGIGLAYVVGGLTVGSVAAVQRYFQLLTLLSALGLAAACAIFRTRPAHPPSASAAAKWGSAIAASAAAAAATGTERGNTGEPTGRVDATTGRSFEAAAAAAPSAAAAVACEACGHASRILPLFGRPGFWHTLVVFCVAVAATNVVGTFLPDLMTGIGRDSFTSTGLLGAVFQLAVAAGGTAVGVLNDRLHAYYATAVVLLTAAAAALVAAAELFRMGRYDGLWAVLPALGAAVGPLKPLMTDLGVDVVFPHDENDVLFVQQVTCNVFSTLLILLFDAISNLTSLQYLSAIYVMTAGTLAALLLFAGTFNGKYLRLKFDVGNALRGEKELLEEGAGSSSGDGRSSGAWSRSGSDGGGGGGRSGGDSPAPAAGAVALVWGGGGARS